MTAQSAFFAHDTELRQALAEAQGADLDPHLATTLLSRVIWARLCEPGDQVAGCLIAALGPELGFDLVAQGATAKTVLEAVTAHGNSNDGFALLTAARLNAAFQRWRLRLDRAKTLEDLRSAAALGFDLTTPDHTNWPSSLSELEYAAPCLLWIKGDISACTAGGLAVVGARACTNYGREVTGELVESVARKGTVILSGAAYGVDAAAHRAALYAQSPTVAVLAGGLDRPYPAGHDDLLMRISHHGAVCSEVPPGTAPTRWRFLQRNRLIAALSQATLVTEAGTRSGSLNTAAHAAELGRPLAAVPGPVTSEASAGCHKLIREYNAELISTASELHEFLGISDTAASAFADSSARQLSVHRRILDALPLAGSRSAVDAAQLSGVALHEVRQFLAELELLGFVERDAAEGESWRLLKRG